MVPEVTPAVNVCGYGRERRFEYGCGTPLTVSVCVAVGFVSALSVTVNTGLPGWVSLYLKLALLVPTPRIKLVIGVRPVALSRNWPLDEVVNSNVCTLLFVATLPNASSNCTVMTPEVTPAVNVCGAVVNANRLTVAAFTVSVCVAVGVVKALSVAVSVGVPDFWSL